MKNLSTFYLFRIAIERDSIALKSAVLTVVYFYIVIIVHNCQQAAKIKLLLNKNSLLEVFPLTIGSGKTIAFENRWSRYKEPSKNKAEAYRVYVEHLFLRSDAGDARRFKRNDAHRQLRRQRRAKSKAVLLPLRPSWQRTICNRLERQAIRAH